MLETIAHVLLWIIPACFIVGIGLTILDSYHPLEDSAKTVMTVCLGVILLTLIVAIGYGMIVGLRPFHWAVQAVAWFLLIGLIVNGLTGPSASV